MRRAFSKGVRAAVRLSVAAGLVVLVCVPRPGAGQTAAASSSPWQERPAKFRLATGPECLYQRDASSAVTVVRIFIPGGKNAVPDGRDGLAYLVTMLALQIPEFELARDIMDQAVELEITVLEDFSVIGLACLSEKLEASLRSASKIIQNPPFTGVRIGGVKETMAIYRKAEQDDAADTGHGAVLGALFSGRGPGGATFGTEASLKAIEKKDVTDYYSRHFNGAGVLFSVCSDLDKDTIRTLLEKTFTKIGQGRAEPPASPAPPALPASRDIVLERETKQNYIARAFLLPSASVDDWVKGYLLEVLLGKGQACRLWDLRTARKLAYGVGARTTWMKTCGLLEAWLETDKDKQAEAVAALAESLVALRDKGVTDEELSMSRAMARGELLRAHETKKARARAMGLWEGIGLGFDGVSNLFERIDAVSVEDMNAFIRRVLDPEKSISVAVGPRPKP